MLLELKQSELARKGLGAACESVIELFEGLAAPGASVEALIESWPHAKAPKTSVLAGVLALGDAEREALRDAVRSDIGFAEDFGRAGFSFSFASLAPQTRAAGAKLLSSLYEEVFCRGSGFRFGVGENANREAWEQSFREANPEIEICPACASSLLEPRVRGRSLIDADHYLPKSRYPPLSVHGLNLVPLCVTCNRSLKAAIDPLADEGGTYELGEIWFPYVLAGISEVGLGFDPTRPQSKVTFEGEPDALERAGRFDRIFGLLERWTAAMDAIQSGLSRKLIEELRVSRDRTGIRGGVETLKRMAEGDITAQPQALVASHYYAWLLDSADAFEALVKQLGASG